MLCSSSKDEGLWHEPEKHNSLFFLQNLRFLLRFGLLIGEVRLFEVSSSVDKLKSTSVIGWFRYDWLDTETVSLGHGSTETRPTRNLGNKQGLITYKLHTLHRIFNFCGNGVNVCTFFTIAIGCLQLRSITIQLCFQTKFDSSKKSRMGK